MRLCIRDGLVRRLFSHRTVPFDLVVYASSRSFSISVVSIALIFSRNLPWFVYDWYCNKRCLFQSTVILDCSPRYSAIWAVRPLSSLTSQQVSISIQIALLISVEDDPHTPPNLCEPRYEMPVPPRYFDGHANRGSPHTPTPASGSQDIDPSSTLYVLLRYQQDDPCGNDHELPPHETTRDRAEDPNVESLPLAENEYDNSDTGELPENVECTSVTAREEVPEQEPEASRSGEEATDTGDLVHDGSSR